VSDILIPIAILAAILLVAFFLYRLLSAQAAPADNPPGEDDSRPLGDTEEAHDEVNPHDLPLDSPARDEVADAAGDAEATTRGLASDGGAGGAARLHGDRESA
jgi:hypothetical protein